MNSSAAPWSGMMGVAAPKMENSFTPVGRGLSIGIEGEFRWQKEKKNK